MGHFVIHLEQIEDEPQEFRFGFPRAWAEVGVDADDSQAHAGASIALRVAADDGEVSVRAQRTGRDILVRTSIRGRAITECARCLEDADVPVDIVVDTLLSPLPVAPTGRSTGARAGASSLEEVDLDPDALDRDFYSGDDIVLDPIVREHILLELPMQPLCRPDCEGIAIPDHIKGPSFEALRQGGVEGEGQLESRDGVAVDPRFAPLLKLQGKLAKCGDIAPGEHAESEE